MKVLKFAAGFALAAVLFASCAPSAQKECKKTTNAKPETKVLASWNDNVRQQIINYVEDVTNPQSPNFVPVADRISTFDNDGTLWSERPIPPQFFFAIDEVKRLAATTHPDYNDKEPFKSAVHGSLEDVFKQGKAGFMQILIASHAGLTADEFTQNVQNWIGTAVNPVKQKKYTDLIYQPMLELLDYLRAHDFKTFIVSGGGLTFMRAWCEDVYGIPRDQVVGSSFEGAFELNDGDVKINRLGKLHFYDDKENKAVAIERFIGRRPIFTGGNSDGDLQMMQYGDSNKYKSFQLYVSHTDGEREFEYGKDGGISALNLGMDYGKAHNWCIVDMKKDWKVVYPFELKK
ncbi:MAG: HAD family hydrolase [Mangrovibacterium sp.]